MITQSSHGPVADADRLKSLDVTRAVALLGIFFVNAAFFGLPIGQTLTGDSPTNEGGLSIAVHAFTSIFCAGKFYPLFSLMFGVGLAIMFQSAQGAGRSFGWPVARRLTALACFGLLHICLLWSGDILLMYASIGIAMVGLARCRASVLLIVSAAALLLGIFLSSLFGLLGPFIQSQMADMPDPAPLDPAAPFFENLRLVSTSQFGVYDPRLPDLEYSAFADGPFAHAMAMRLFLYFGSLIWIVLFIGPQLIACFCFGAALLKLGYFHAQRRWLRTLFIGLGLGLALPLNIAAHFLQPHASTSVLASGAMMFCMALGGPLAALMYLTLIMIVVERAYVPRVVSTLAPLGRMGLTGYLGESLLMCFVMQHWGLAMFDSTSWAARAGIVIAIWMVLVIFANIWFRTFRMGPMEWLWRTITYLRVQPILKRTNDHAIGGSPTSVGTPPA